MMQTCVARGRNTDSLDEAEAFMQDTIRPRHMNLYPRDTSSHANREYLLFHQFALSLSACDVIIRSAKASISSEDDKRIVSEWGEEGLKTTRE
jgi:hypothetical protein